jgi:hypothetical protein
VKHRDRVPQIDPSVIQRSANDRTEGAHVRYGFEIGKRSDAARGDDVRVYAVNQLT